jgi:hypothetical protein
MKKKIKSRFGIGPMSLESIEAVYRFSNFNRKQLMLIASKNQIDHSGGYVNGWSTKNYVEHIKTVKNTYNKSDVLLCRDHCGPGFNGDFNLEDTYKTIESDIENDFDLLHIDFCHYKGTNDDKLKESKKAIEFCKKLNDDIFLEIGTDENLGDNFAFNSLNDIEEELDYFTSFCNPDFFVVQTGSLVMEVNQVGNFNDSFSRQVSSLLNSMGIKFKEHNADYLTSQEIAKRKDIVNAMNIAPQFGVIQTGIIINKCLMYGIDYSSWANLVYNGNKWKKWLKNNTPDNKNLCINIAGHYHFNSDEYKRIFDQINQHEDIREVIIESLIKVIEHYENSF